MARGRGAVVAHVRGEKSFNPRETSSFVEIAPPSGSQEERFRK